MKENSDALGLASEQLFEHRKGPGISNIPTSEVSIQVGANREQTEK
jgi:hypothetical protein